MRRQHAYVSQLRGLDGTRYSEEAAVSAVQRGGYNVELLDGEWWTRSGMRSYGSDTYEGAADIAFWWVIDYGRDSRVVIANPWWALEVDTNPDSSTYHGFTHLYKPRQDTDEVSFIAGSVAGVYNGTEQPLAGDLIMLKQNGFTDEIRVVLADAGGSSGAWIILINRPFRRVLTTEACRLIPVLAPYDGFTYLENGDFGGADTDTGGWTIFEQLVDYSADELNDVSAAEPFTHPEIDKGSRYLIITSRYTTPVAIDLEDNDTEVIRLFFRNTAPENDAKIRTKSDANTTANDRGAFCGTVNGRLFIGQANDDEGRWPKVTFWVSRYGDFTQWHVGLKGKNAKGSYFTLDDNTNPIMGMAPLADSMVIHRESSQDVAQATGSAKTPINIISGMPGYGLVSTRSLVVTNRGHYLWTQAGPAIFDGTNLQIIGQHLKRHLESMQMYRMLDRAMDKTNRLDRQGSGIMCGFEDTFRQRIVWVSKSAVRHPKVTEPPLTPEGYVLYGREWSYARPVLVYDYGRDDWFLYDCPTFSGGGSVTVGSGGANVYGLTCDGYVYELHREGVMHDEPLRNHEDSNVILEPVDCYVETGWMNFGSNNRKKLIQIRAELRPLNTYQDDPEFGMIHAEFRDGVLYPVSGDDLDVLGDTLHFATVRVIADTNDPQFDGVASPPMLVYQELKIEGSKEEMLKMISEENRQGPRMICVLSPNTTANKFKFAIRNEPQSGSTAHKVPFRISALQFVYEETMSDRVRYPYNRRGENDGS